jgi:hypothetical protein
MKMRLSTMAVLAKEASHLNSNSTSQSTSSGDYEVGKASVVAVKSGLKIRKFCRNCMGDGPSMSLLRGQYPFTVCHCYSSYFFYEKLLHTSEISMTPQHKDGVSSKRASVSAQNPDVRPSTTPEKIASAASDNSSLGEDNSTSLYSFSHPGMASSCRKNLGERLQRR